MFDELKQKISNSKNASSLVDSYLTGVSFKRKKKEYKYPYRVYSPFEIGLAEQGLDDFYLVGKNWLNTNLPVIVAVGCNDWKLGFLADYLPEYRVAFLPRKKVGVNAVYSIRKIKIKPEAVLIWGYTESKWLAKYLSVKSFKVWRVEDGFLRSAELGAAHTTPYSLVVDKTGFYYNCYERSDIESLLLNYDFSSNKELLSQADECLRILKSSRLSKYNPSVSQKYRKSKTRKRIAVLGQVDKDASIKYGNPGKWTSEDLVKLAYVENPGSEIIYRPHPEVFKGFQKSAFRKGRLEKICDISSPEIDIVDFIENVDHIYTITSLSGFEAVLRGKKVTVVGVPFYAGWGLTDDRVEGIKRNRKLSVTEVFAASYLLYPKYLADLNNPYYGFLTTCLRIQADKYIENDKFVKTEAKKVELIKEAAKTYKWPQVLLSEHEGVAFSKKISFVNFDEVFGGASNSVFSLSLCMHILGVVKKDEDRDVFLSTVRSKMPYDQFNYILLKLQALSTSVDYLHKHWAWLFKEKVGDVNVHLIDSFYTKGHEYEENQSSVEKDVTVGLLNLQAKLDRRDFNGFYDAAYSLLIKGVATHKVLMLILEACDLTFDFEAKKKLSLYVQGLDIYASNRNGLFHEFSSYRFLKIDLQEFLFTSAKVLSVKPELTALVKMYTESFIANDEDKWWRVLERVLELDNDVSTRKVQAYIALEKFDKALELASELVWQQESSISASMIYAQALSYSNKLNEAKEVLEKLVRDEFNSKTISELLKVYVLIDEYSKAKVLLERALENGIRIGDMHKRKIYFGTKELEKAFYAFSEMLIVDKFKAYYSQRYYSFERELLKSEPLVLLAIFGPGDEIRFASIYKRLKKLLGVERLILTCSPKLTNLMRRSFSDIEFVEVSRIRNTDKVDLACYSNVPGSDIMGFVNNAAVEAIEKAQGVAFVTDMLHHLLKDYDSFDRTPYLLPNQSRVSSFQERLPKAKKLVGISWRSSLTTTARNLHYLSIEQLMPLFDIAGVQFVNFQYDDCVEEISYVNSIYPGKIIDFAEIDHYNDFDSVAALMQCMDLIISPATTVAELAGAIGCKTWLFSNSTEIDWRKTDTAGRDVWHSETEIIDVPEKGNKEMLVNKLKHRLIEFVSE